MKIIYNQNPLKTQVFLDDQSRQLLRAKIHIDSLEDIVYNALYQWSEHEDIKPVMESLNKIHSDSFEKRIDDLVALDEQELLGEHLGDCTCMPMSCMKCHAESMLGIDTVPGLGKHEASYIHGAFGRDGDRSIDEAIESLSRPISEEPNEHYKDNPDLYRKWLPKWNQDRIGALQWLIDYKNKGLYNDT